MEYVRQHGCVNSMRQIENDLSVFEGGITKAQIEKVCLGGSSQI